MKPNIRYPLLIGGLLAIPVTFVTIAVVTLSGDPSFAVEPDYYKQAVDWDQFAGQREANRKLGWTAEWSAAPAGVETALTLRLSHADGTPVTGVRATTVAFFNGRSGERQTLTLAESAPGLYAASLARVRPGLWELRLSAQAGEQQFTNIARVDIAAPRAPR